MDPISIAFGATTLVLTGLITGIAALATAEARQDYRGTWRGHEVIVRNLITAEELYIDGVLADRHEGFFLHFEATLAAEITEAGRTIPVHVTLGPTRYGMGVATEVYIDGQSIGLQSGPVGELAPRDALHTEARVPADPRWNAVSGLLESIRAANPDARPVANDAQNRIRCLLLTNEQLLSARDAHEILDAGSGDSTHQLDAFKAEQEAQIQALFRAVQQLHLTTLRGAAHGDGGPERDMLARLSAEAEVADPRTNARRRAQNAQLKRTAS